MKCLEVRRSVRGLVLVLLLMLSSWLQAAPAADVPDEEAQIDKLIVTSSWSLPDDLLLRARVTSIEPVEPFAINWRYGGEGLGGNVTRGSFTPMGVDLDAPPDKPGARKPKVKLEESRDPRFTVGEWSRPLALRSMVRGATPSILFLTITAGKNGETVDGNYRHRTGQSRQVRFEFELLRGDQTLKRLTAAGPEGGTVGLVFPFRLLGASNEPITPAFLEGCCDLLAYAQQRDETLRALPWAGRPLPRQLAILTDLNGHGQGIYFGIRYTDLAIAGVEVQNVRELGVNGLRGASWLIEQQIQQGTAPFDQMRRVAGDPNGGYPVPHFVKGRANDPDAGCPYAPGVPARQQEIIAQTLAMLAQPYGEIWSLTEDEIGAVVDRSAQGKAHLSSCPRCIQAYRDYVRAQGCSPHDLGAADWEQVVPLNIWDKAGDKPWLTDPQAALNAYHSRLFINHASAQLFTPLRDAVAQANARKQAALAAGQTDTPVARQPWLYTYALRGNNFLLGGHSLDFFDFYRLADNGFCHETSNRDPRIWSWDSYLLDVGRMMSAEQQMALGLYVKPHRGAPVQRALAAAGRGARMIFWYTYGPDYAKGDSFSENPSALALTSKAARLLGAAEEVLWESRAAFPAQTAIIKPRASEVWMQLTGDNAGRAAWEDAKFTYTALTHSFVPVDPLDQQMVRQNDLSGYRVVYLLGPNFPRAAAEKLLAWVEAGGTLVLHAGALARDEANQPLTDLYARLGVTGRQPVEMWKNVTLYGATRLQPFNDNHAPLTPVPETAMVSFTEGALAQQQAQPVVGREVLLPTPAAQVLARYADGGAAALRHRHGAGQVVLLGVFAGLEYTAPQRDGDFDMRRDVVDAWRSLSAGVALHATERPAWCDQNNIELRRIVSPEGKRGLMVLNWGYRVAGQRVREVDGRSRTSNITELSPVENLRITLPRASDIKQVRSAWSEQTLTQEMEADGTLVVTLPKLEEADVLLLE